MAIAVDAASQAGDRQNRVPWYATGFAVVALIAALRLLLHLLTANRYGYFRDELYYLACAEHLDWGYVDQPPLIAGIAWFSRAVLGHRCSAFVCCPPWPARAWWRSPDTRRTSRRKTLCHGIVSAGVALAAIFVINGHLLTMNVFEPLIWMGCASVLIRIIQTGNQKLWLWFGVLAGVGLENKYSMAVFGFAVVIGLLLTPERRAFTQKWIWLAGIVVLLIFLPNLLWNINHHWPFVEVIRNIKASGRDVALNPVEYFLRQVLEMNPLAFPLWFAGLGGFSLGKMADAIACWVGRG